MREPIFERLVSLFNHFLPRLSGWTLIAVCLLILLSITHPSQLGVVLYKASLVVLASVIGYWIDRSLFPYARPHRTFSEIRHGDLMPSLLMLRRAIIVLACILGLTLGL